jgi:hypothetical protein
MSDAMETEKFVMMSVQTLPHAIDQRAKID